MLKPNRLAQRLLPLALLASAGCGGNEPVFDKLFTSEHFEYYVEEGATPPCDGVEQWLERYYEANARFFGATLSPGEKMKYHVVGSRESLSSLGCSPDSGGCADGTTISAFRPIYVHELVHASASLLGDPPDLFKEGLADVLGCTTTIDWGGRVDTSDPIELLVETGAFQRYREVNGFGLYVASASFVRFLIGEVGAARFLSFYAHAARDASRAEVDAVFRVDLGMGLDEAFARWRAEPPPYFGDLCLRLMECDPSMPSLADGDVTLGCGPGGDSAFPEAVRRFQVTDEAILQVTMDPQPADPYIWSYATFYRCSGGDVTGVSLRTAGARVADGELHIDPAQPGSAVALNVPPGEYVAWLSAPGEARIHVGVEQRGSPMRDAACKPAEEPLALSDTHPTTLTTRWVERPCVGPWCPGQSWDVSIGETGGALEASFAGLNLGKSFSPSELYICAAPCPEDTSQCEILALDPKGRPVRSAQTFAPGTVLHLGAPAAPYADRFAVWLRAAPE